MKCIPFAVAPFLLLQHAAGSTADRPFALPALPYEYNALEPYIDEATMRVHHTKHHQTYTDKLNDAWEQLSSSAPALANLPLPQVLALVTQSHGYDIPTALAAALRNHGGGFLNHALFWSIMTPAPSPPLARDGDLAIAIEREWGTFEAFQAAFGSAATRVFGSGWAWLGVSTAADASRGRLGVRTTANQDTAAGPDWEPILGLDVWEHAYYLAYQNRRVEYIDAWWHVVHWQEVERRFADAVARSRRTEEL